VNQKRFLDLDNLMGHMANRGPSLSEDPNSSLRRVSLAKQVFLVDSVSSTPHRSRYAVFQIAPCTEDPTPPSFPDGPLKSQPSLLMAFLAEPNLPLGVPRDDLKNSHPGGPFTFYNFMLHSQPSIPTSLRVGLL